MINLIIMSERVALAFLPGERHLEVTIARKRLLQRPIAQKPARCCIASTFDFCRHGSFTLGRA